MHGRFLTGSVANVFPLDADFQNNRHHFEAGVYGFQRDKGLYAEIVKTIQSEILVKLLMFLRSPDLIHNISAELTLELLKCIRADIYNTLESEIDIHLIKQVRAELINHLASEITIFLQKKMAANDAVMGVTIGTIDKGKVIADIQDLLMSDIQDLTISDIATDLTMMQHGLRLGVVKPLRISDIQDFTIAQIQDKTIDEICFVRIL